MKKSWPLAFLLVIIFAFFIPFIINPSFLTARDNDLGRQYVPLFSFLKNSVQSFGQIPLWQPDQMMGQTFIGSPWSSLFYPANLLFLVFPVKFAAVFYLFVHFLMAGIFTFYLAKDFKLTSVSSFAAALFYGFSTKMLLHLSAGHITMIAAFSFFPLLFLSVRKTIIKPSLGWLTSGAVSATFIYMTYPTIFYYAAIFMATYWIYLIISFFPKKHLGSLVVKKQIISFTLLLLIFLGLSSVVLLPQLEFAPASTRSTLRLEDVAIPLWNSKRFLSSLFFPYLNLNDFDHESFLYLGVVPTFLFVVGFIRLKKVQKIFLIFFGFLTLLFIVGLSAPFFEQTYKYLPFLKYSRVTTRLWFTVALVVSLIAASSFEKIKNKKIVYIFITVFLIESSLIFYKRIDKIPSISFDNQQIYQYISSDKDLFRVYCTSYCFNPQLISKYQIQTLHGETPIQDAAFVKFLAEAGNYDWSYFAVIFPPYQVWQKENPPVPNADLLGNANVKYIASTYEIRNSDFVSISKFDNIFLYQNRKFKPRAYFEGPDEPAKILKYTPNGITFSFNSSANYRNLIISENFYPGWIVYSNHQKFNVQKQPPIFRKVIIPSNSQILELKYQPESFALGKTISLATVTVLILWYIRQCKSTKGSPKH